MFITCIVVVLAPHCWCLALGSLQRCLLRIRSLVSSLSVMGRSVYQGRIAVSCLKYLNKAEFANLHEVQLAAC